MMEGWKKVKLSELANIYSGFAFKGKEMTGSSAEGVPLVKIKNIFDRKVSAEFDSFLKHKFLLSKHKKYQLLEGDVLVAMTGQGSVGRIGKMHSVKSDIYVNQRVGIVRVNEKIVNKEFVYQQMANSHNESVYFNLAMGAGQPNLSPKDIGNLKINFPPLPTQRKIATILSAYDDIIENNLKRIKLLEEKAQRTYEEWFVRLKFPGHENTSINKETGLPEGWKKVKIKDTKLLMIDGDRGKNYPKQSDFKNESHCLFLNTGNVTSTGFNFQNVQFVTKEKDEQLRKGKLQENDLILTTRGTVGNVAFYNSLIKYKHTRINSGMLILRCLATDLEYHYLNQLLISNTFQKQIKLFSYGAAQPQLPVGTLKQMKILKPSSIVQKKFASIMEMLINSSYLLKNQNQLLKEARDILLPRLMTGMIDPEQISGQVVEKLGHTK